MAAPFSCKKPCFRAGLALGKIFLHVHVKIFRLLVEIFIPIPDRKNTIP